METSQPQQKVRVVLPTNVRPSHYDLRIKPDLVSFTFSGEVIVIVQILQETNQIVLNAADLTISKATFTATGGAPLPSTNVSFDTKRQTATIEFASALPLGEGSLALVFAGILNDQMKGFYRSNYTKADTKENAVMAVTQFEPTDARFCFPCWDEPAIKATFDVTLVVPKGLTTLSNMPVISEEPEGENTVVVKFDKTPIMSTYLLALIVGEFDYLEGTTTTNVKVRVYTPVGKKEQGRFALEVALKTLPFYNEYFGIPYPLPKADLVAIPDFAAGAMENWGCITYRETALLVDPLSSSLQTKQWVALVVGHELAHQWFGNIVTMEWWTHLWLNEGFATWIEYLCVDHCFPEYEMWTQFVFSDFGHAMSLDSLKSTHPVEVEVGDPAEIDEIFDAISYNKGASIIRMLATFLGEADYKKGLNLYLNKHQYANAVTEDLWSALATSSNKPVKELMDTWTKQDGYPVVTLDIGEQEGTFTLTQERFFASGPEENDQSLWWIPFSIISEGSSEPTFILFKEKKSTITIKDYKPGSWVKANPGQTGFYRVKYSMPLLERLIKGGALESPLLDATDRLGIQSDAWALAQSGQLPTPHVISLISAYRFEKDYTVWADLTSKLSNLDIVISNTESYEIWNQFLVSVYVTIGESVGWEPKEGESHSTSLLRSLVITKLGLSGHAPTIAEAQRRFKDYVNGDEKALSPDLKEGVYRICLAHGDETTFETVLALFRKADMHEEKERCMESLGSTRHESLLQRTLEFAISEEVRPQDSPFVMGRVSANSKGRQIAWDFIKAHWEDLKKRYSGGFLLSRIVKTTQFFASEEKAKEVEAFFAEREAPSAERALKQSVESIRLNAAWLTRDGASVEKWLADWVSKQ